ncbi:hypothetical protein [Streptomyces iakyrus]|uniref:hypothetical protein n=1 Tax=Streptomyces iakyrus TaxID=68219 RepID=UPI0036C939D4
MSSSRSTASSIHSQSRAALAGVKARLTSRRSLVWLGGSEKTRLEWTNAYRCRGGSPVAAAASNVITEEKSGSRRMRSTSSRRVTIHAPIWSA